MNKKLVKEIERRKAEWKAANRAQKRVLLAKDALAQVEKKRIKPTLSCWVNVPDKTTVGENVQEAVLDNKLKCQCCALGGLLLSATLYKNKIKVDSDGLFGNAQIGDLQYSAIYMGNVSDKLKFEGLFGVDQLALIEQAFEVGRGFFTEERRPIDEKAVAFGNRYKSARGRFKAIMENIIQNNGTFVP